MLSHSVSVHAKHYNFFFFKIKENESMHAKCESCT